MKTIKFKLDNLEEIINKYILPRLKICKTFTFKGPLGVGKTTMIKKILQLCGIKDVITSPTFNYVNTYNVNNCYFNHFDLYRLNNLENFLELGFDEYLYNNSKNWNFIEWPEVITPLLSDDNLKNNLCKITLNFDLNNIDSRVMQID